MWPDRETRYGYMCGTSWECEMEAHYCVNKIYGTIEAAREHSKCCLDECGIAKVKIELEEWALIPKSKKLRETRR